MNAQEWALRHDRFTEHARYHSGEVWAEEAWARRCGFATASEYHDASREAFEESVRDEEYMEAYE